MFDKAPGIAKDAQQAWAAGAVFFTPIITGGKLNADWAPSLQAITEVGWKLHTWAVGINNVGSPTAMPLFTR